MAGDTLSPARSRMRLWTRLSSFSRVGWEMVWWGCGSRIGIRSSYPLATAMAWAVMYPSLWRDFIVPVYETHEWEFFFKKIGMLTSRGINDERTLTPCSEVYQALYEFWFGMAEGGLM